MSNKEYIAQRVKDVAKYIVETNDTVRGAAKVFGISKSTVYIDVTERLKEIDPLLQIKVLKVLEKNKNEKCMRGGESTRKLYEEKRKQKNI
mgnify:CR=1 FL=1